MKSLVKTLLVLSFVAYSGFSFSQEGEGVAEVAAQPVGAEQSIGQYPVVVPAGPQPQEGSKPGVKFRDVSFAVSNIKQVIESLDKADFAAGNAISKDVIWQVHERIKGAVVLINHIITSDKLSSDKRSEYLAMLMPELGELIFYVLRHHGEDKLKNIQNVSQAKYMLNEFLLDTTNFVSFRKSVLNETVWGPMDRANRDELSELTADALSAIVSGALANMSEDDPLRDKASNFWVGSILDKALMIRGARLNAQRLTALVYLGAAFWGLVAPGVDFVGLIDGRSENSLFVSSIGYFSLWVTIASLKAASISSNTIDMLKALKEGFQNPELYARRQERSLSLMQRMTQKFNAGMCKVGLRNPDM